MRVTIMTFAAILLFVAGAAWAQGDTTNAGWTKSLINNLTVTQTSYSDSWVGGEAGSVNWVWNLDGTAERPLSPKVDIKSTLRLKFGQTLSENAETKHWAKPVKSTDLIDWENVLRFTLGAVVDPYAAVRLESQFFDATWPMKNLYLSPLKLTESFGVARVFFKKDKEVVTSRIGFAVREIFKKSVVDTITRATTDSTLTDGGMESVTDATLNLGKNLQYVGKLGIFKAFFSSESNREQPIGKQYVGVHWSTPDVNWENTFTAAVTKIINVSLYTQLLYDRDIDARGRFKETLALGFSVRLM